MNYCYNFFECVDKNDIIKIRRKLMNKTLETYIEILKPEVDKLFGNDKSGHDTTHLTRTLNLALYLQKREGGDEIIIGISAFLHDVHRIMQGQLGKYVSPKESLPTIKKMLNKTDLSKEQKSEILYCIEFHEAYNWNDPENKKRSLEAKILQDADNLDAMGAIGIVRSFSYGVVHNIPWYDSSTPLSEANDFDESIEKDASTIHHFYHKLFKLAEYMNTKTARKLGKKKVKFMKEFARELISELESKF